MYRGRAQLGQDITLEVMCHDVNDTPTLPDTGPSIDVYLGSTKLVAAKPIPILDRYGVTALFQYRMFLDGTFSVGTYSVVYTYTVGSYAGKEVDTFEIVAGGDAKGAVIGMYFFSKPQADFIVQDLSSGKLVKNRNPSV